MPSRFLKQANNRVSLGGAASIIIGATLAGQILGFLRNRLISTNFTVVDPGASDAFFAAFQIPDFFFYTIAAGALGVAFIPVLSDRLQANDRKGLWNITSSLLSILAVVMAIVGALLFVFARPLITLIVPNLPEDHLQEAVTIMRIIAFNPLLFSLSGIITSVQQTFGRFFFYAVAPISYNLAIIISVYLFRDTIGIVGLGWGALAGALLQLAVASLGLYGLGFKYRPKIAWRDTGLRSVLRRLPPRSLDQGIDQVNSIVEVNRAQNLGVGAVSYYNYALTLMNVPIMLIGNSIATAVFPRLTERLSQGRPDLFRKDFLRILQTVVWLTFPVIIVSYFARGYMARLIFGDVSPEVALIFGYLTAAIFFRIIYALISRWFYAQKDTRTPLLVSVLAIGLNIYLAFTLAHPSNYGISGLALAQSITAGIEVVVLSAIMINRDRKLINKEFINYILRVVSVSGFTLVAGFIMITLLPLQISDRGFVVLGAKLGSIVLVTFAVYLSVSAIFGIHEAKATLARVRNFILRPINI